MREKPREYKTPNQNYVQEIHNGELQGDDLQLAVLATGGGITQRRRPLLSLTLSLSPSLSAALSLHSPRVEKQENEKQQ